MSAEDEHTLLLGLLQRGSRVVDVAHIEPEYISDPDVRGLFSLAKRYHEARKGRNTLDLSLARSLLEKSKAKRAGVMLATLDEYAGLADVSKAEWSEAVTQVVKDHQRRVLREHGAKAAEALTQEDYGQAKKVMRRGLLAAEAVEDDRPADLHSQDEIQQERVRESQAHKTPKGRGFNVGFPKLMTRTAFKRYEQMILAGYSGDGKSHMAKTISYHANRHGARVLFISLEMEKAEMRAMFLAQHAATIDPRGVKWCDVLNGEASRADRVLYRRAMDDFEYKPGDEGDETQLRSGLWIWSPKKKLRFGQVCDRVRAMHDDHGIDIVVVDYLELVEPDRDLGQYRLNVKDMAEQGKALSREEPGVLVILNHQISREGRDRAEKRRPPFYLMRDLGESSGVERSADHIAWILTDDDMREYRQSRIGLAKVRKGRPITRGYCVMSDFERANMAELRDDEEAFEPEAD